MEASQPSGSEFVEFNRHIRTASIQRPKDNNWTADYAAWMGHFLYMAPSFEFLNEAALIRHSSAMMGTFNTLGFYSQVSRKWHAWRPFVRYNYLNAPEMEPIFTTTGRQSGPAGGLRYDVNESVALKLQFDHLDRRAMSAVNIVTMQTSFVF